MRVATIGICDPGYSEELARAQHVEAVKHIQKSVSDLVDVGLQSDEYSAAKIVADLAVQHARDPFDALFLLQVAWARPAVVLQIVRTFPQLPMIVYSPGSKLVDGRIRSIAPAAGAGSTVPLLRRHGIKFKYVWSSPGQAIDEAEFVPFLRAARAVRKLSGAKLGMVGFGDMRLQSTGFDVQELHENFGVEVESVDMFELQKEMDAISSDDLTCAVEGITSEWTFQGQGPGPDAVRKVVAMYTVLDNWAKQRNYVGLSIKCPTGVSANMGITPCLAGCLLARKYHYVCENDIPGLLTQLIMGLLTDQMSTYWELYEILEDGILLGCCGFCPEVFLDEPMRVRTLQGFMTGMACCSHVRNGPYTLARLGKQRDGQYVLHCSEGEAFDPPAWYEDACGDDAQHPSVKFVPQLPVSQIVRNILAQHFAVVQGHWAISLNDFAYIKNIATLA